MFRGYVVSLVNRVPVDVLMNAAQLNGADTMVVNGARIRALGIDGSELNLAFCRCGKWRPPGP
jgi:hypothetical protein